MEFIMDFPGFSYLAVGFNNVKMRREAGRFNYSLLLPVRV